MGLGVAIEQENSVADKLVQRPAVFEDDLRHAIEVAVQDTPYGIRQEGRRGYYCTVRTVKLCFVNDLCSLNSRLLVVTKA